MRSASLAEVLSPWPRATLSIRTSVLGDGARAFLQLRVSPLALLLEGVHLVTVPSALCQSHSLRYTDQKNSRRCTHGKRPRRPNVSRSSIVNPAPLFNVGSFSRARPRSAVQMGRCGHGSGGMVERWGKDMGAAGRGGQPSRVRRSCRCSARGRHFDSCLGPPHHRHVRRGQCSRPQHRHAFPYT